MGEQELQAVRDQFAQCRERLREPQMAFADKVIINKIDLVSDEDAADVNVSIASINPHADVMTASNAVVNFDWVLEPRTLTVDREELARQGDDTGASICPPCA